MVVFLGDHPMKKRTIGSILQVTGVLFLCVAGTNVDIEEVPPGFRTAHLLGRALPGIVLLVIGFKLSRKSK